MTELKEETRRGLEVPADVLAIDPDEMRRLGYWVVDRVVQHIETLDEKPVVLGADYETLAASLEGPLPRDPSPIEAGLQILADVVTTHQQHGDHPRYFARVPGPSSFTAILGEWLATGSQTIASSWAGGSGPSLTEMAVCAWLRDAVGLAPESEGVLVSGGSMANITALITAQHERGPGVVYLSDQTHASIRRGLLSMGQSAEHLRTLETDDDFRLPPKILEAAIKADLDAGLHPRIVVATAGTTNTGAVDDIAELASICARHELWLHVDGAYGGPAAMTHRSRAIFQGLDLVDSFVLDPHKWLFQPYDVACLMVRWPGALERTFAMNPEYLVDLNGTEPNLHNRSLELTRRGRALKLWLTFRSYGADALARAIERGIALAEYAQHLIERDNRLRIVTPAQLGIVTFEAPAQSDDAHRTAALRITESGYAAVSTTVLAGRTVLRLCIINPRTTTEDLAGTISRLSHELSQDIAN